MRVTHAVPLIILAATLLIVVSWLFVNLWGLPTTLQPEAIREWLEAGPLPPLLVITALMITAVVVGPVPTFPVSASAGMLYGVVGGTLVAATGASIGALIAFWIARLAGRDWVRSRTGSHPLLDSNASQNMLFGLIAFTRLVPLFSFALISYAAGLTAIRSWRFVLASFIGMLPMTVIYAGLGHSLTVHPVLAATAGVAVIVMMWLVPPWLERRYGKRVRRWLRENGSD